MGHKGLAPSGQSNRDTAADERRDPDDGAAEVAFYSDLSASTGSTRDARHAGTVLARIATPVSSTATTANVIGSAGVTPCSNPRSRRVMASDSTIPVPMPTSASDNPLPSTILITSGRRAPIATRIPISRVRRLTRYDSTP